MSRSTPTPFVKKNNEEAFKGTHKKHKGKKGLTHHKPKGLISVGPSGAPNKKKVVQQPDSRLDSFLQSVDNLESDWKELEGILDKKAKEKAKPKPPVSKPKPEDIKKPLKKPEPDEEDRLEKPEDEGDEEQEQQPPKGRQQPQKPPFRRTNPRNDEE